MMLTTHRIVRSGPSAGSGPGGMAPGAAPIDVIVPVYNEAAMIEGKLANLAQLAYPMDCLRVFVVDGGSDDGTAEIAERWALGRELRVTVIQTRAVGKPAQLNAALERVSSEWVLVTDADARLAPGALGAMVRALEDPQVGLVGTEVLPADGHPLDRAHWTAANWLLRLERRLGTAGLVVGPCYLVRRRLLDRLPADTVSDDVRVSCRALLSGARIDVVSETVYELRTPDGGLPLFRHKVRKARGYLHEMRSMLPRAWTADPLALTVLAWRGTLLVLPPVLLIVLASVLGIVGGWAYTLVAGGAMAWATAAFCRPCSSREPGLLTSWLGLPIVTSAVLLTAVCLWPFTTISPRYPRVQMSRAGEAQQV